MPRSVQIDDEMTAQARFNMVECQIKPGGVRNYTITDLIGALPREEFVGAVQRNVAYGDLELACDADGHTRTILTPLAFARLAELASPNADDVVLDIAGGTGYSAAILAGLSSTVIALEETDAFGEKASETWKELGVDNVVAVTGALPEGQAKQEPFDVIFINGCVEDVPQALLDQLAPKGRLVCVKQVDGSMKAVICKRIGDSFSTHVAFDLSAPHLPHFDVAKGFEF